MVFLLVFGKKNPKKTPGIGVLVPHADGAGNDLLVGRYLQLGCVFYTLMTIPGVIIWAFCTEAAVRWFGFDDETAIIGQEYAYTYLIYLFVDGIIHCFAEFLNTLDHERYATVFTIVAKAAESLALLAITMVGVKDLVAVGLVQVAVSCIAMVVNFAIIMRKGWLEPYWEGFIRTNGLRDRRAMHTVLITAIPLGLAWLLTFGEVRSCRDTFNLRGGSQSFKHSSRSFNVVGGIDSVCEVSSVCSLWKRCRQRGHSYTFLTEEIWGLRKWLRGDSLATCGAPLKP
jgi:hypothetical protein